MGTRRMLNPPSAGASGCHGPTPDPEMGVSPGPGRGFLLRAGRPSLPCLFSGPSTPATAPPLGPCLPAHRWDCLGVEPPREPWKGPENPEATDRETGTASEGRYQGVALKRRLRDGLPVPSWQGPLWPPPSSHPVQPPPRPLPTPHLLSWALGSLLTSSVTWPDCPPLPGPPATRPPSLQSVGPISSPSHLLGPLQPPALSKAPPHSVRPRLPGSTPS